MTYVTVAPDRAARLIRVLFVIQLVSMGAMEMSGPFWPIHLKALSTSSFEFGFAGVAVYVGPMLGIMLTTYGVGIESPLRRARLFAYLQVSTNLGSLAGAVAGGLILDHATFFWINVVAAVLCVCCAVAVALILPNVPASKRVAAADAAAASGARFTWRSSPIPGLLGVVGMLLVSRTLTQTPFSLYVSSMFGVGNWVVGLCYGMLSLGFVVSASLWARYFENRTLPDALRRMTFIALVCAGLTLAAGLTRNVGVFTAIHFLWGILLGATTPVLMSLISRAADGLYQGYVLGIAQSTTQFSSIAGIAMGGWLSDSIGLQYTYFFVAASYLLAMAVVLALRRERGAVARPQTSPGQ
ncbi:MFS transporter [Paraburkholderia sp. SIMBA_030]|uniref:MFS transporter n=1 Tax=Paraburkholderia sp. SIMBA_030 TaxID=3085773 RepID=UPI00397A5F09